jgi:hypothetical protein
MQRLDTGIVIGDEAKSGVTATVRRKTYDSPPSVGAPESLTSF